MTPAIDPAVTALVDEQHALDDHLDGLDDRGWAAPSRCAGWSVSDVVLHLAQTNEMAVASLEGTMPQFLERMAEGLPPAADVDAGAAAMVERERGAPPADVRARWDASVAALRDGFAATDLGARVTWVVGELSVRTLATTRLAETWIHGGDVAVASGPLPAPTDRLWHIARLAWRTVPYAFARAGRPAPGPVVFDLVGPGGAAWRFGADAGEAGGDGPVTTVRGDAVDLCLVAGQRADAADTGLVAEGPDGAEVLALVRTFA
jgi:uncharacterized protein (TIGR03084 family)